MTKSWPFGLRPIASSIARDSKLVAFRGAQGRAQVGGVLLSQAHVERAGAGQAHPVAAFAEIVGHRRDETQPPAGLLDFDITRRTAGLVSDVLQRELALEIGPDQRERQILVHAVGIDLAHRHRLDHRHIHAARHAPSAACRAARLR